MAKPRVFVSSTYYDLKYIRSSLELFISSLGFDPVLFEHGGVAFAPDKALDDSCYREVKNSDLYVLIIGGRYGSEKSETKGEHGRRFYEDYESVTKIEYQSANEKNIPIYILIEKSVYAEYLTYRRNPDNESIHYAHVDHSGVFRLVGEILSKQRNNPMQTFDRYSEIEEWFRAQWAGLYRDLLARMHQEKQIATLSEKVSELNEITKTLRRYLEDLVERANPEGGAKIVNEESARLKKSELHARLKQNEFLSMMVYSDDGIDYVANLLKEAHSLEDLRQRVDKMCESTDSHGFPSDSHGVLWGNFRIFLDDGYLKYWNEARDVLGLKPYQLPGIVAPVPGQPIVVTSARSRPAVRSRGEGTKQ